MSKGVFVLTGCTRGLGKEMARQLAAQEYTMVLICRTAQGAAQLQQELTGSIPGAHIHTMPADLESATQVKQVADCIKKKYDRVSVLINNAAVFNSSLRSTAAGLEQQYAVNYLSAFGLTLELADMLERTQGSRVINLGSNMHRWGSLPATTAGEITFYNGLKTYANTKLAITMFTLEFAKRFPVCCHVFHPGPVNTAIGDKHAHGVSKYGWRFLRSFFPSPGEAAGAGVYLATSPELNGKTGLYFHRTSICIPSARSRNNSLREKLWDSSMHTWQQQ